MNPDNLRNYRELFRAVYRRLLSVHGRQGWWPITNPRTGESEYHVGAPRDEDDFVEISVGAILTQNVAWNNVASSLANLKREGLLNPDSLLRVRIDRLGRLIRSTGYYNQKAKKLRHYIRWYRDQGGWRALERIPTSRLRHALLSIHGIGPETADSILLYGFGRRIFVVDAYTVRLFTRLGALIGGEGYPAVQALFHQHLRGSVCTYREYHALIVAHGKDYCKKHPACDSCCLRDLCRHYSAQKRN